MIGIYKITNPNNRIYVGQAVDIKRRFSSYNNLNETKKQPALYRSFKKYGIKNHIFEVIEECSIDQLDEREIYWGEFFDVLGENGLNCRLGKGRGLVSNELRERMKTTNKGKKEKKVYQYDLKGNFIKEWKSIWEAEKNFHSTNHSNISACCLGKQKTAWGFIWSFKKVKAMKKVKHGHLIDQFDLEENFIKTWDSVKQICDELKYSYSTIYECLNKKYKTANGYIWKYK